MQKLNERSYAMCETIQPLRDALRVKQHAISGATVWDFGIDVEGGLSAGIVMSEICLSALGEVKLEHGGENRFGPCVSVHTDHPIRACLASQYAGWHINVGKYFAMGSGPMRAVYGHEELFADIQYKEESPRIVGVLETSQMPDEATIEYIAETCRTTPDFVTLLVAPTASQAGTIQIVARSVETALHKMHELGFDVLKIKSAHGCAPLPPVAGSEIEAIGRTNDAILYGASVTLWLRDEDSNLEHIAERIPSCASRDFGRPFREIFEHYGRDFYKIDKHLFSPAQICLVNLETGNTFGAGEVCPDLVRRSFG